MIAVRFHSSFAVHPGAWLRTEIVEANRIGIGRFADHLHVSRQALSSLLNGQSALLAEMAVRFERALGLRAETLPRMQTVHDLATARSDADALAVELLGVAWRAAGVGTFRRYSAGRLFGFSQGKALSQGSSPDTNLRKFGDRVGRRRS